jgi:hypothetical protein
VEFGCGNNNFLKVNTISLTMGYYSEKGKTPWQEYFSQQGMKHRSGSFLFGGAKVERKNHIRGANVVF